MWLYIGVALLVIILLICSAKGWLSPVVGIFVDIFVDLFDIF